MDSTAPKAEDAQADDAEARRLLLELAKVDATTPLGNVKLLNLTGCDLDSLPRGFEKSFPNLSILFLSNNHFRELPAVIGACPKLQMVAFKANHMESIHPEALQPQLRWLILTDNVIQKIPDTIGRCKLLQKCMLSGNRIQTLPPTIQNCTNLELIRLASNQLSHPPMTLLQLPNLAWIALSDNPFLNTTEQQLGEETLLSSEPLKVLHDLDDEMVVSEGEILGQGAGGITRKVVHPKLGPVAVKTYAGNAMTSDGLPAHERRIARAASTLDCPGLVRVLGQTAEGSLVMEFLERFGAMAGPPSFETCSRDVYPENLMLTTEQGLAVVITMLQALTSLHTVGICHGDFYGHNILVHADDCKNVRLSDFGAAFFYIKASSAEQLSYGSLLERIELRAFGIFVAEVNGLLMDGKVEQLRTLSEKCRDRASGGFDSVFIWWKQQQLTSMAKAFGSGVDETALEEEKR